MMTTVRAVMREGQITLLEPVQIPDGTEVLVTLLPDGEAAFWTAAGTRSLDEIWNNPDDDVYAELLQD